VRRHWPLLAGVGFAAAIVIGLNSGTELAPVLAAAALVYLGSAALQRPTAAWPLFFATAVVITVGRVSGNRFEPTWVILAGAVLLLGWGLVRGAGRPRFGLPLQSLAFLGFGAVAAVALLVDPTAGSYLVAAGLLGHAGWDLYHYRTDRVVARSLAEFCLVLDTALAAVIVLATASS
jgi:hypothetical protein